MSHSWSSFSYFLHGSWSLNIFSVDLIAYSFVWTDFSTMREKAPRRECVCLHHTEHSCCCCSSFSCVWVFTTPWTATHQAFPSFTISQSLLRSMSTEWMILSNHLILCHPLILPPSIFPRIRVFFYQAFGIRWPKYWSFSLASVLPKNTQDWFPLRLTSLISSINVCWEMNEFIYSSPWF